MISISIHSPQLTITKTTKSSATVRMNDNDKELSVEVGESFETDQKAYLTRRELLVFILLTIFSDVRELVL